MLPHNNHLLWYRTQTVTKSVNATYFSNSLENLTYADLTDWLIGRKSNLSTHNKLLLYKAIIKPIWTYGIQLWGCTKPSNSQIIQRVQSKILRMIYDAPWYVSNKTLHESSATPLVEDEIHRLTQHYLCQLSGHAKQLVYNFKPPPATRRRLRRQ